MEDLYIGKLIEKGSFGKVYKGRYNDQMVAVKKINKATLTKYKLDPRIEIDILNQLDNTLVIKLLDFLEDKNSIYHVLEYAPRDLFNVIVNETISEKQALKYIKSITRGLLYLNSINIAHLDIKPENILITFYNKTKITDFGHARVIEPGKMFDRHGGTIFYLAPEIVRREPYDYTVDIWSLGIMYYEMLAKKPVFFADKEADVYDLIMKNEPQIPETISLVTGFNILQILSVNRPSFAEILNFKWH
tara:strand:- start:131 stop:871 length:741 start_codon:yes stop_codon:yes gene_type:complete